MSTTLAGAPVKCCAPMPRVSRLLPNPVVLGGETFGQRLHRFRKERGYTQTELAEKIGTLQAIISEYEHDKLRPHADMLIRFALALDVSADELLGLKRAAKAGASPGSRKFLRRLQQMQKLPKRDQDALLRTIDAFLSRSSAA